MGVLRNSLQGWEPALFDETIDPPRASSQHNTTLLWQQIPWPLPGVQTAPRRPSLSQAAINSAHSPFTPASGRRSQPQLGSGGGNEAGTEQAREWTKASAGAPLIGLCSVCPFHPRCHLESPSVTPVTLPPRQTAWHEGESDQAQWGCGGNYRPGNS